MSEQITPGSMVLLRPKAEPDRRPQCAQVLAVYAGGRILATDRFGSVDLEEWHAVKVEVALVPTPEGHAVVHTPDGAPVEG